MMPLTPEEYEKIKRDDLRAEYTAVVSYHTAIVVTRFTIAGLIFAGSGFLASAAFSADRSPALKAFCGGFAVWITICIWILELRNRGLYRTISKRAKRIEREDWEVKSKATNDGLFTVQILDDDQSKVTSTATPTTSQIKSETPTVFGFELSDGLAKQFSHSNAFDLLYLGTLIFWLVITLHYGHITICRCDHHIEHKREHRAHPRTYERQRWEIGPGEESGHNTPRI